MVNYRSAKRRQKMSDDSSSGGGGGCSCSGLVIAVLVLWALWFGLPWPGGAKYNIDIFPPRVWDMNATEAPITSGQ
jgi:hypothetical protein